VTYALLWGAAAALAGVFAGYPLVAWLRERKLGKAISTDGPESHLSKAGTPTFGGALIFGVAMAFALIAALPKDSDVWLPIVVAAVFVPIGLYDDLGTLVDRENREAHDRTTMLLKIAAFAIAGTGAAWALYEIVDAPRLLVPHYGHYDLGPVYVVIAVGVIVATTSAVGVTDGLDMLLGSTAAVAFIAYGAIALMQDQEGLATFCFVLVGALCGFLWHNAYPARLFMGDTGSLALGAVLAVVALQTGWWLVLPVIGVIFVAEALSDVIQIGSYRLRGGKRVFRMAPLHIHFEKLPLPETQVTVRFLVVAIVGALVGVALAALD
jgi:phospho-N-acetylmuramoyl-pentapeptide-transferase